MRPRRYLKGNAASEIPTNLMFVNSKPFISLVDRRYTELRLRLWTADVCRIERGEVRSSILYDGETVEQFWDIVDERVQTKKPLWIVTHRAKYDMKMLEMYKQFDIGRLIYLQRSESKKYGIMAIDRNPWFVKCQHKKGGWVWIVCLQNYWDAELKEIGDSVGVNELPINIAKDNRAYILLSCARDTEIVKTAFCGLLTDWSNQKLGNFRTSAAGLSLQNFRHWHSNTKQSTTGQRQRYDICTDPDNPQIDFERDGFFGGRIEAFYYGTYEGIVYHLDVNSMYPSVMRQYCYPVDRSKTLDNPQVGYIEKLMPAYEVMAECFINSGLPTYPLRKGKRQVHANGQFWTMLCGAELRRAINNGDVMQISKAVVYKTAPIFTQWVDYWWDRRKKAERNGAWSSAKLCKLILNSLHGKFSQRGTKWIDSMYPPPMVQFGKFLRWGTFIAHDADADSSITCRVLAGKAEQETVGSNPEHCFPAISAVIAANVRERLLGLIRICPADSVLYTAVDSLIVTQAGYNALLDAGELNERLIGKLSVKGKHRECEIVAQGCYRLDDTWTACGLWAKAEYDYRGKWASQTMQFDRMFNFTHDGRVIINHMEVEEPRQNPKGDLLSSGFCQPWSIIKSDSFYQLPIQDQRKQLFEEI